MSPRTLGFSRVAALSRVRPLVVLLLAVHVSGAAQDTSSEIPAPNQDPASTEGAIDPVSFFYEATFELSFLLEICSVHLGRHIEYDPQKVGGPFQVQTTQGYTKEELWELANRELAARGFATIQPPGSDSLRVVSLSEAASLARLEDRTLADARAGYVKVMVPLIHRTGEDLVETVELLLSKPGGAVSATKDGTELVLSDFTGHVAQALSAIEILDREPVLPAILEVELEHATPIAIATLFERVTNARKQVAGSAPKGSLLPLVESGSVLIVAPSEELGWWQKTIARFDRSEPALTVHYAPRRFGLQETARLVGEVVDAQDTGEAPRVFRMVTDELTGSLIVTASPAIHSEIESLLSRLERTEVGAQQPVRFFEIKNRRVSEVLALLQGLLEKGVLDVEQTAQTRDETAEPPLQGATGEIVRGPVAPRPVHAEKDESPITLVADEGSNRLIAFGEARLLEELEGLIASFDVRRPQVLVETLVVTLTESETLDFGAELQAIDSSGQTLGRIGSLFGLGSPDPAAGVIPPLGGTGFAGAVLDPGDWSAVVRALEARTKGRSLTIPKVLVQNNEEATLDSVLQSPFAATNASTTVATTSFGGTLDAGTQITVKPQLAEGDHIVLEYTVSLSSFTGASTDPSLPPPRQENKLASVVTIPDGYTVVVGGLEIESQSKTRSYVPFFGRIPVVGELFGKSSRTDQKTRFFVFLRCSAMKSERFEDLRFESRPALAAAGVDDGWPVLEPRILR